MANEIRLRQNFLGGKVEDNPLSAVATTLTSAGLAYMSAVTSTSHMPFVLDPDGIFGEPEIAYVTAHTGGATTATIARGQEGTTARGHQRDVDWVHGPTTRDFFSGCKATMTGTVTIANTTSTSIPWAGASEYDTDAYHSTSTNNDRITVPTSGIYLVGYDLVVGVTPSAQGRFLGTVVKNGTTSITGTRAEEDFALVSGGSFPGITATAPALLTAGDYVTVGGYQNSGGTVTLDTSLSSFWIQRVG